MPSKLESKTHRTKLILPHQPSHDEFLVIMSKVLNFSRWFGVAGSGRWYWKVWGYLLVSLLATIVTGAVYKLAKALAGYASDTVGQRSVTTRISGAIFYQTSLFALILSWRLSSSWKSISDHWISVEKSLGLKVPSYGNLRKIMIGLILFTVFCSTLEFVMNVVSKIGFDCPPSNLLREYTMMSHGFMLLKNDYSIWIAVPLLFMSVVATILWNFQDLLIILISFGLASRYYRLNQYISKIRPEKNEMMCGKNAQPIHVYTWRKIRESYVRQAMLVRAVDKSVGGLLLLSSFGNFYFICLQLFLAITQGISNSVVKKLYSLISLCWLCMRTTCVVLAAADVNVHSRRALQYLYASSEGCYNIEVERLQNQLSKDYVALSGLGFFYLNRTILLQMLGAVITYELVLIQFDNQPDQVTSNSTLEQ